MNFSRKYNEIAINTNIQTDSTKICSKIKSFKKGVVKAPSINDRLTEVRLTPAAYP